MEGGLPYFCGEESESRTMCRQESHQPFLRTACSSATVISPEHVAACRISSAMRCRRLKSAIALTTASRLVFAPVKRMASDSSASGISIVVFMPPDYRHTEYESSKRGWEAETLAELQSGATFAHTKSRYSSKRNPGLVRRPYFPNPCRESVLLGKNLLDAPPPDFGQWSRVTLIVGLQSFEVVPAFIRRCGCCVNHRQFQSV